MGLEAYVLAEYRESLAKSQYIRLAAWLADTLDCMS
jgi:hypothetical protein